MIRSPELTSNTSICMICMVFTRYMLKRAACVLLFLGTGGNSVWFCILRAKGAITGLLIRTAFFFFFFVSCGQVMVVMSHVGIEPELLLRHMHKKETDHAIKVILKKHGSRWV